jgi:hypothetical protein
MQLAQSNVWRKALAVTVLVLLGLFASMAMMP